MTMMTNKAKNNWELVDDGSIAQDHWAIRIKDGTFEGVEYQYGAIKFNGEDDNGNALVSFEYAILEDTMGLCESYKNEFEEVLGEILHEIMTESLAKDATQQET